ncbi:hypothetical protein QVD17_10333 [Tagetes erecta]|uniref:BHLH domain-containing protein n=1 Tax=Tagetes erecta TaxID=13708 RepID=A0AAD8L2P4_TARER|nr:hypothetical protein QVD17_10333 [Tagetes erecta]
MESYGINVFDEEWVNLSSMFFCEQDSNQFTGHALFSTEHDHGLHLHTPILLPNANDQSISSSSCVIDDQILAYASDHDHIKSNFYNQESGNVMEMEGDSSNFMFLAQVFSDDAMDQTHCLEKQGKMENSVGQPLPVVADLTHDLKRKYELIELEGNTRKTNKKNRAVLNDNKNKKNLPPKKNQKMMASTNRNNDESVETYQSKGKNSNGRGNAQSSSCCSSEDDSNASQELNGREIGMEKTRAGRGAATDPQSIYARKRRERINERLRTLQTLVPNGTKVDISTMLEEAVHYVKFLQLQINLLSSDDKWMYAPIAYNGVDMGLYNNISPSL